MGAVGETRQRRWERGRKEGGGREEREGKNVEKRGRGERDGKLTKAKISAYWLSLELTLGLPLGLPSASWSDWKDPALLWLRCGCSCGGFKAGRFSPLWEEVDTCDIASLLM